MTPNTLLLFKFPHNEVTEHTASNGGDCYRTFECPLPAPLPLVAETDDMTIAGIECRFFKVLPKISYRHSMDISSQLVLIYDIQHRTGQPRSLPALSNQRASLTENVKLSHFAYMLFMPIVSYSHKEASERQNEEFNYLTDTSV